MRYARTLGLVAELPARRPAHTLPSRLDELFDKLSACPDTAAGRFDIAETRLAILVRRRPDWAEAWNKQATLHYLRGRDDEAVAAIHRTLELEPRHFGALAALGEVLRAQGAAEAARLAFGCALRLYPLHAGVRHSLRELEAAPPA